MKSTRVIEILARKTTIPDDSVTFAEIEEALAIGIEAVNKIDRIKDMIEGTIDHLDRDDALDLLTQIKEVIE